MTINQIITQVSASKPLQRRQIYRYFKICGIKPTSDARQHPQQYPDDSGQQILSYLGFSTFAAQNGIDAVRRNFGGPVTRSKKSRDETNGHGSPKIVSMRKLKSVRRKK